MTLGVNDYPWPTGGCTSASDPWGCTLRQCTSFCAFRITHDLGQPFHCLGNGNQWAANAAAQGIRVDSTPARGAIAATTLYEFGHVAVVLEVGPSAHCGAGQIWVEDYNWNLTCSYLQHCVSASNFRYLHIGAPAPPPPPPPPPPPVPPVLVCPAGYQLSADHTVCEPVAGGPAQSSGAVLAGVLVVLGGTAGGLTLWERRHPGTLARAERRARELLDDVAHPNTAGPGGKPRAEVFRPPAPAGAPR